MNSNEFAWNVRRHGLEMTRISKGSHIGPILSVADIIAVLYANILNIDPANPHKLDRDRVVLSKGHAGAAIYAALAERGFFDIKELLTHYADGSLLSGHVSHKGIPGVEFSTGSLGHGLPVGAGMAMALKKNRTNGRVFVILGDGECDEGSVWEAALIANHYRLDNLVAIVDYNKMQSLDFCDNTIELSPFDDKWRAFGWQVVEVDGHDHGQLRDSLQLTANSRQRPTVVIAHTVKGKGISFMENNILWHYRTPQGDEYNAAVAELDAIKP